MKISLIHATRGRPQRCLEVRQEWLSKAVHPENVEHIFGVDADDLETIGAITPLRLVIVLEPRGCFKAYNAAASVCSGDLILPIEDDLHCEQGWDDLVREVMAPHINEIATLAVCDGQNACIEWAFTRAFYKARGLYHKDYFGLFADTEIRTRLRQDEVLVVSAPQIRFDHRQFQPGSGTDPIYERKQGMYLDDERTFNIRSREGWPA
jgi:hypothetical protein